MISCSATSTAAAARGYIEDGKFVVEDSLVDFFRLAKEMIAGGCTNSNTLRDTAAWYADAKGTGDVQVLGSLGAPWLLAYHVMRQRWR